MNQKLTSMGTKRLVRTGGQTNIHIACVSRIPQEDTADTLPVPAEVSLYSCFAKGGLWF